MEVARLKVAKDAKPVPETRLRSALEVVINDRLLPFDHETNSKVRGFGLRLLAL